LQEIKSLNAVMAYYLHGDGSLYGRLFYNGAWSTETLLSSVHYKNLTAPFQVPVSHGNKGYLFGNTAAGSGYLIVVDVNSGNVDVSNIDSHGLPESYFLHQNYPNPFNPITRIGFRLPRPSRVILEVFDVSGHLILTLYDKELNSGSYEVDWDGRNSMGQEVASGVYFYRLKTDHFIAAKKMLLIK
jgi:hypothetical protein